MSVMIQLNVNKIKAMEFKILLAINHQENLMYVESNHKSIS